VVVLQAGFTSLPPMGAFFGTRPIDGLTRLWILGVCVAVFVLVATEKWVIRNRWLKERSGSWRRSLRNRHPHPWARCGIVAGRWLSALPPPLRAPL
jgi:hypothetical protein